MAKVRAFTKAIQPVLEEITITQNGVYTPPSNIDGYNKITAMFPIPIITTKNITANGTYNASDDGATGYSSVNVNVPGSDPSNKYFSYVSTRSNKDQTTDVYTCIIPGKYLVINIDIIGQSNTGHSTIANIASSATISDYAEQYTAYGSNNNRDCTIRCALIDLAVNDTVTFTNSGSSNYASRLHAIIPTDINSIDSNWIDTITDTARDASINKSGSTSALLLCAQSSGERAVNVNSSITNKINVPIVLDTFNNGMSANIGFSGDNWSCTMNTDNISSYASKIYAIFDISQ